MQKIGQYIMDSIIKTQQAVLASSIIIFQSKHKRVYAHEAEVLSKYFKNQATRSLIFGTDTLKCFGKKSN